MATLKHIASKNADYGAAEQTQAKGFWRFCFVISCAVPMFVSLLNFPKMFVNTLIIAIFSCLLSTCLLLSVSYCLSRMRFKMRKPYMNMAMILGLFPGFMSMVAVYFILKAVGLTEGNLIRVALVFCYSGGAAIGFQVTKGFFDTTPYAIDEAAMLDGCTRWQISIPIALLFLKLQKYYVNGTSGAVKG